MTSSANNSTPSSLAAAHLSTQEQPIHEVIRRAHQRLARRFEDLHVVAWPRQARDLQCRADAMLTDLTRHVNAVRAVVVDELRAVDNGDTAIALRDACHRVERTAVWVKARLYGSSAMAHCSFADLVTGLELEVKAIVDLENVALADLDQCHDHTELLHIALRLHRIEETAPTRPHPHLPHRGRLGSVSRAIVSRTDALWDTFEGRCAPAAEKFS
ncbi:MULTISPECIES: hypothetical protein [Nocardioides]|uniref:hypothetical protein n=1 Tax=Nocardioides TaxID=1839 RepID=UPI00032FE033|nr:MULTISPECIES: hypothetical protein [Nocardioides]EON22114.1 hypothetical protein CF8_4047 [Nocardioides sp. CF8]